MATENSRFLPPNSLDVVVEHSSNDQYTDMGAVFSPEKQYRYYLWREWEPEKPTAAWVMANPSDADGFSDDQTINVIRGFSKRWGYGSVVVANLFACVSTDPAGLDKIDDPIGPLNDRFLQDIAEDAELLMGAWGSPGDRFGRPTEVMELLDEEVHALTVLQSGNPGHPTRKSRDLEPAPYTFEG